MNKRDVKLMMIHTEEGLTDKVIVEGTKPSIMAGFSVLIKTMAETLDMEELDVLQHLTDVMTSFQQEERRD